MDKILQDALIKDFPVLFQDVNKPMTQTCMCWGCSCSRGWEPLLRRTFEKLAVLQPPVILDQVKEKFGGLRIYYHGGPLHKRRWFGFALFVPGLIRSVYWRVKYRSFGFGICFVQANRATYWPHDDPAQDIVDAAERESFTICEACGQPGTPNEEGWISTLCPECRKNKYSDENMLLRGVTNDTPKP